MRAALELADIFRAAGPAYRANHAGHLSLAQLKVMSAIETCRTAALGGHVESCEDCGHRRVAYNSCRNRHCPRCQGAAAREWLAAREADLLPVGYFHVVFTVPAEVADIALHNKALVYDLLFKAASETMLTIAADPRHLGARIGITAVLHTWGSAMTHHPHIHMIVPGGGISLDGARWISSRRAFLLPVRVLGKLFRRLFLTKLLGLHAAGRLQFFGAHSGLSDQRTFNRHLAQVRRKTWVVYAKPPFSGPEAVLAYLSRYTHRVAISNSRLISFDEAGVAFRYKDYRRSGGERYRVMTLHADEFVRRFLLHVLPTRFPPHPPLWSARQHRPQANVTRARELLGVTVAAEPATVGRACRSKLRMSLLRRTHDHHRHLPACLPSPRTAAHGSPSRDEGAMTRHGQPPPTVEAMLLQRSYHRACRSRQTCIAASMTPRRPRFPARHHPIHAFKARRRSSTSPFSPRSQGWRSSSAGTGFPKPP